MKTTASPLDALKKEIISVFVELGAGGESDLKGKITVGMTSEQILEVVDGTLTPYGGTVPAKELLELLQKGEDPEELQVASWTFVHHVAGFAESPNVPNFIGRAANAIAYAIAHLSFALGSEGKGDVVAEQAAKNSFNALAHANLYLSVARGETESQGLEASMEATRRELAAKIGVQL